MTVREPGGSAGIADHENLWAEPSDGGAQLVISGRIPVPAALDATDAGWRSATWRTKCSWASA
jgi:hypothetical protein